MLLLEAQSIKVYPGKGHGAPDKYLGISVVGGEGHPDTVITSILSPCLGQSTTNGCCPVLKPFIGNCNRSANSCYIYLTAFVYW